MPYDTFAAAAAALVQAQTADGMYGLGIQSAGDAFVQTTTGTDGWVTEVGGISTDDAERAALTPGDFDGIYTTQPTADHPTVAELGGLADTLGLDGPFELYPEDLLPDDIHP